MLLIRSLEAGGSGAANVFRLSGDQKFGSLKAILRRQSTFNWRISEYVPQAVISRTPLLPQNA